MHVECPLDVRGDPIENKRRRACRDASERPFRTGHVGPYFVPTDLGGGKSRSPPGTTVLGSRHDAEKFPANKWIDKAYPLA